jgi:hypothetical protein
MELTDDLSPTTSRLSMLIEMVEEPTGSLVNKLQNIDESYYYNIEYCLSRATKLNPKVTLAPAKELKEKHKKSFFPIFVETFN